MNSRFLGMLTAVTIMLSCAPLCAQVSTPVLVVYGNAYDYSGIPVDDTYFITVSNLNTGTTVQTEVESGVNSGRYSVVFIDLNGSAAATEGDFIRVEATKIGGSYTFVCREHIVTLSEINSGEVFLEEVVDIETVSWGAVKQIYRSR